MSRSITGATGGNLESLAASTVAASTSITDTIGTTTVSLTADPTIAEGGNITYTASLGATAHGDVLATITGGSVITIASGSTQRHGERRRARTRTVYLDSSTVSRSITGATGGNFESLAASDGGGEHQHHRHHRHHHGEPDGRPDDRRGRQHHLHREPGRHGARRRAGDHHRRQRHHHRQRRASGTVTSPRPTRTYLDSSTVSRSIHRRHGRQLREPGGLDGGGEHQHHRHHRHHHGEPDGRRRSPRAATSPTPASLGARRTATCW
ncbi:MAG: hypothetical protein IPN05_19890 [Sulfuritalea sp.]|nr:hypothetical protein [Sulfuritalea sp.]